MFVFTVTSFGATTTLIYYSTLNKLWHVRVSDGNVSILTSCLSADNIFSSLAGLRFLWQLLPKSGKADDKHHLVHVPLKETPLSDCGGFCGDLEMQIKIEDQVCKIRLIFHILLLVIVVSNSWLVFCTSGFGIRFACGEGN